VKVLVANPPWPGPGFGARSDVRWPHKRSDKYIEYPIYLSYAVAVLGEAGFEASFVDAIMEELSIEDFASRVAGESPDLVVLECSTPTINYDLLSVQKIKERLPDTFAVLAGSHASVFHQQLLAENPDLDGVCRGEFELTARHLAQTLAEDGDLSQVEGLSYREDGEVRVNPPRPYLADLDQLPFPDLDIVPCDGYRAGIYSGKKPTAMISSRGCPYQCRYCLWPQTLYGHRFRARSATNVVDEMERAVRDYGVDEIYFDDDCLTIDKRRVMEMCRLIDERDLHVDWICQARVDTVDREMLEAMKAGGCHYILFGVESGSPRMLRAMRKGMSLDRARDTFRLCHELEIKTQAYFLFGFPGEDEESVSETIAFAKELEPDSAQFAVVIPHPGTELFSMCQEKGWLVYESWEDFAACNSLIETDSFSREDAERARIRAYREFYFRPSLILKALSRIRRWKDVQRLYRGGLSVLSRVSFFERARG